MKYLCLFLLLISISIVSASWNQEANAGLNLAGGQGFIAYASNQNNILTSSNITYESCTIDGSDYSPAAADFNGDNISDIVVVTDDTFKIYDSDCSFLYEENIASDILAMPVISNMNNNEYQEVIFLDQTSISAYEYDGSDGLTLIWFTNYTENVSEEGLDKITCSRAPITLTPSDSYGCIMFKHDEDDTYFYNYSANSTYKYAAETSENLDMIDNYANGLASGFYPSSFIAPICYSDDNDIYCDRFSNDAQYDGVSTGDIASASFAVTDIFYSSTFIVKMGNIYRWLVNIEYEKNDAFNQHIYSAYDTLGNSIFNLTYGVDQWNHNVSSNWMVGDFGKTGVNWACILMDDANSEDVLLKCYDAAFNLKQEYNMTSLDINDTKNYVMADYLPNMTTLGIANSEGIYYPDYKVQTYSTIADNNRSAIVYNNPFSGSPVTVFSDNTATYIIRDTTISTDCGNGVCDTYESAFSCPVDCGTLSDQDCIEDTDCPLNYPKCLSNKCVSGYDGSTCNHDTDCPYDAPYCYANYCIAGISGTAISTDNVSIGQPDAIESSMNNAINLLTGGNATVKFIVGFLIFIAILISSYNTGIKNNYLLMIIAGMITILNFLLGFWPIVIPVIVIIMLVVMLIAKQTLFNNTASQ